MHLDRRRDLIVATDDFRLTQREIDLVRSQATFLLPHLKEVADIYYAHLLTTHYARLLTPDRIDGLKAARVAHWQLLLTADFAAIQTDYMDNFGPRLLDGGFPQSIFVVASQWLLLELGRFVDRSNDIPKTLKSELRGALTKFAFFDLALAQAAREVAWLD